MSRRKENHRMNCNLFCGAGCFKIVCHLNYFSMLRDMNALKYVSFGILGYLYPVGLGCHMNVIFG